MGRKTKGVVAAWVLLSCALWLALRSEPHARVAPTLQPRESSAPSRSLEAGRGVRSQMPVLTAPDPVALADDIEIESVEVDRSEICKGEQVTVSVRAKARDGLDEYLNYGVEEQPQLVGPVFTLHPAESIGIDWLHVFVRGRMGSTVNRSIPPVYVKDCPGEPQIAIAQTRDGARPDRVTLTAIPVTSDGSTFEPSEFNWDFGDGQRETTSAGRVEHSYETRRQASTHSYFLVKVSAVSAASRRATSALSLRFVNLGFLPWASRRELRVFAAIEPAEQPGGAERISLYHGSSSTVLLDRVTVSDVDSEDRRTNVREYSASSLLGVSALPPGRVTPVRELSLLTPTAPGTMRVVELSGSAPQARTVGGGFTLLGPKQPDPASEPVADVALEQPSESSVTAAP